MGLLPPEMAIAILTFFEFILVLIVAAAMGPAVFLGFSFITRQDTRFNLEGSIAGAVLFFLAFWFLFFARAITDGEKTPTWLLLLYTLAVLGIFALGLLVWGLILYFLHRGVTTLRSWLSGSTAGNARNGKEGKPLATDGHDLEAGGSAAQ